MAYWMKADTALLRVVEDDGAGIMKRVRALEMVERAPMALLRRLILEPKTPRKKPIPSKLRAVAALRYAKQLARKKKGEKAKHVADNPLGIT